MNLLKTNFITVLLITILLLAACNSKNENATVKNNNALQKESIAVTINPLKLIIQEIIDDDFNIITILPVNASPHTFEPKPSDVTSIQNVKLLFYVSDNLDIWAANIIKNETNVKKIKLIDFVIPKLETISFFNNSDFHHSCCNHNDDNDHNCNHNDIDPHFWTSPTTVKTIIDDICKSLIAFAPQNKSKYIERSEKFIQRLDSLHSALTNDLEIIKDKPIFTFHNSFYYFIEEFGLSYGGSFEESPGKEPGTKHFTQFANKIKNSNSKTIFSEPQLNSKTMEAVANEAKVQISELDPIGGKIENQSYFDFINQNAKKMIAGLK